MFVPVLRRGGADVAADTQVLCRASVGKKTQLGTVPKQAQLTQFIKETETSLDYPHV